MIARKPQYRTLDEVLDGTSSLFKIMNVSHCDGSKQRRELAKLVHKLNPNLDAGHLDFHYSVAELFGEIYLINRRILKEHNEK